MSQQRINIGANANDGLGDSLRVAFGKINNNFSELFDNGQASGPSGSVQYRTGDELLSVAYLRTGTSPSFVNRYVIVGSPKCIYTSLDASNWTLRDSPTNYTLRYITSDSNQFIAVGDHGSIFTSVDGITWTQRNSGITENILCIAVRTNGNYAAVTDTGNIITSSNAGATWVGRSSGISTALRGITYSQNSWVAVGDGGVILIGTADGTSWTQVSSGVIADLNAVAQFSGDILAVGNTGTILQSGDLTTWNIRTSGTVLPLKGVSFVTLNSVVTAFAVGEAGKIISSSNTNFTTWSATVYPSPTVNNINSATSINGALFAVGTSGTIVQTQSNVLVDDSIPAGLSGSSKFVFDEQANTISVAADIVPQTTNTWSIGNSTHTFKDVWVGPDSLHIGAVTVSENAIGIRFSSTANSQILANITANRANLVTVNADTINGNAANINGNITVSGNANIANLNSNNASFGNFTAANSNLGNVNIANITVSNISVTGNITANNATLSGNLTASYLFGNGSQLTGIATKAAGVSGSVQFANANLAFTGDNQFLYDSTAHRLTVPLISGNLTGNVTGNVTGNLTGDVTGNVNGNITGNITGNIDSVYGNFVDVNVSNLTTTQELVVIGGAEFQSNVVVDGDVDSASITTLDVNAERVTTQNVFSTIGNINTINASNVTTVNLTVETGAIGNGTIPNLVSNVFTANDATITRIVAANIGANRVTANTGNFAVSVTAPNATFDNLQATATFNASAITATIANVAGNVNAGNVNATTFTGNLVGDVNANNVVANSVVSTDGNIANITSSIISAQTVTANLAGNVTGNVIGNISGTTGAFTGNVNAVNVIASGSLRGAVIGSLTGNVNGNISGTTGTFTGNLGAANVNATNANITGNLISGNANVRSVTANGNVTVSGNIVAGNIDGGNLVKANYLEGVLTTQHQPNITQVGFLNDLRVISDLIVGGNMTVRSITSSQPSSFTDVSVTGNLTVAGNTTYTNVTSLVVQSPIIEEGGAANGAPLTSNDGRDRGLLMHYYTNAPIDAFFGFKNSTGEFILANNVSVANNIVTVNTYGNLRLNGVIANTVSAGLLTGNVTSNVITANTVNAAVLLGDGSNISGLPVKSLIAGNNITLSNSAGNWTINAALTNPAAGSNTEIQFANATGGFASSPSLTFNSSTSNLDINGNVNATRFYGPVTGDVSGNISGTSGIFSGNANATNFNGTLRGNVVGNVTGNISGTTGVFTGNVDAGNVNATNLVANRLVSNLTANVANIRLSGSNISAIGTSDFIVSTGSSNVQVRTNDSAILNSNSYALTLKTGNVIGNIVVSGSINLTTGEGGPYDGSGGNINITTGNGGPGGTGGFINIIAGTTYNSPTGVGGANVYVQGGNTSNEDGGAIVLQGGNTTGPGIYGGNIHLTPGTGSLSNGYIMLANLRWPNADGSNGQTLTTDGNGVLIWGNAAPSSRGNLVVGVRGGGTVRVQISS